MPGKRVIVIGAGFGGLSSACYLAKSGFEVTVIEKNSGPGGRAAVFKEKGFTFDAGPSWYLMPDVFEKFFADFGKTPSDYFNLKKLDPQYRMFFGKNDFLDISDNLNQNFRIFDKLEKNGAEKFQRYLKSAKYQYDIAMKDFLYRDYDSIFDFFNLRMMTEGLKLRVFENFDSYVSKIFKNDRIRKILEYTMVFLGGHPKDTPAFYSIMSHVDFNMGGYYPLGGMYKVVEAMVKIGRSLGVKYIFNEIVTGFKIGDKQIKNVNTDKASYHADIVLGNADYQHIESDLLPDNFRSYGKNYWKSRTMAPSAFMMYLGIRGKLKNLVHHNLFLAKDWMVHFDDIFRKPKWPDNPSYYISCPSKTDDTVSPNGDENIFILVPVASGIPDSEKLRNEYSAKILSHMEKQIGEKFVSRIKIKRIFSQRDFSKMFNAYQGTALGLSHTLFQTAIFRPARKSRKLKNLYFTGNYTHPGIGMPMTIISGELAARRIYRDYETK